jgi:O-antigen ligase
VTVTSGPIVGAYFLLCLILGGSAQGAYSNLAVKVAAISIAGWALLRRNEGAPALSLSEKTLLWLAGLVVVVVVVQLIPLSPALWLELPGRPDLAEGYRLLGQRLPWMPISIAPVLTQEALLGLVPAFAALIVGIFKRESRPVWTVSALLLAIVASVIVGFLQVSSSDPFSSFWYFYPHSNFGSAIGFFANSNHMGILLLIGLPFSSALIVHIQNSKMHPKRILFLTILVTSSVPLFLVGAVLNGSVAVLLLSFPTLVLSAAILIASRWQYKWMIIGTILVSLSSVFFFLLSSVGKDLLAENSASVSARAEVWAVTLRSIAAYGPFGTGLGSFADIYRLGEDSSLVTRTFVNHAHNDYLEVVLETGLPGLILMGLFFIWWLWRAWVAWKPTGDNFSRAAAIASALLLIHSIVDYPLRTPALSVTLVICLALMAEAGRRNNTNVGDLWPPRHSGV